MASQNEYYYKNRLLTKMNEFIDKDLSDDHDLGYLSENLAVHMAEAAYLILKQNQDVNEYIEKNQVPS